MGNSIVDKLVWISKHFVISKVNFERCGFFTIRGQSLTLWNLKGCLRSPHWKVDFLLHQAWLCLFGFNAYLNSNASWSADIGGSNMLFCITHFFISRLSVLLACPHIGGQSIAAQAQCKCLSIIVIALATILCSFYTDEKDVQVPPPALTSQLQTEMHGGKSLRQYH